MAAGLDAGIHQFNVESMPELELLEPGARERGASAPVALRVNPDVDARTHAKISTGKAENKFGIDIGQARAAYAAAARLPGIEPVGLGGPYRLAARLDLAPYRAAFAQLAELVTEICAQAGIVDPARRPRRRPRHRLSRRDPARDRGLRRGGPGDRRHSRLPAHLRARPARWSANAGMLVRG